MVGDKVMVIESFSGKKGISEIIEENFGSNVQVIGVRDRDYETTIIHERVFYYDYSCMEMMFIDCLEAFRNVYSEYYAGSIDVEEIRSTLLIQLRGLSTIWQENERNSWGIRINGVSLANAFDHQIEKLDMGIIINNINEMNGGGFVVYPERKQSVDELLSEDCTYENLLHITRGHDFLQLFAVYCSRLGGRAVSDVNISASLRCAYRKSDFESTLLYAKLVEHEESYSLRIVS